MVKVNNQYGLHLSSEFSISVLSLSLSLSSIAVLCIGCVLSGHYKMTQRYIKKKSEMHSMPMPRAPSQGLGKYILFFFIAIILPALLIFSPFGSTLGPLTLWYWVILFVVVVPIVMIYGHLKQMHEWRELVEFSSSQSVDDVSSTDSSFS